MKVIDNLRKTKFMSTDSRIIEITDYNKGWIHIEVSNGDVINLSPEELAHIHNWVHNQEESTIPNLSKKEMLGLEILKCRNKSTALRYEDLKIKWDWDNHVWIVTDLLTGNKRDSYTDIDALLDYLLITPSTEEQTLRTLLLKFKESKVNPDKYNPYVYAPILRYNKHNIRYYTNHDDWVLTDMETGKDTMRYSLEEVIEYIT